MSTDNPKGYENPDLLWTPAQLKERMDDPNLRIVDTRKGERFTMGHISVNLTNRQSAEC